MAFKPTFKSIALVVACCLPLLATAQVYTWKDANGRTHFSDQPPANSDAKLVRGTSAAPDTSPSASASAPKDGKAAGPKSWADQDRDFKQRMAEKTDADAKAKKEKDDKDQKEQYCISLRSNLAMLERGGRISQPDVNGNPSFLSDDKMKAEANRVREQIAKDCK